VGLEETVNLVAGLEAEQAPEIGFGKTALSVFIG